MTTEEYMSASFNERLNYLYNLTEDTNLKVEPSFILSVLQWEAKPIVRWHIIKLIGLYRLSEGIPYLLQLATEKNEKFESTSIHLIIAWSLGRIGNDAIQSIEKKLLSETNEETVICLADSLGELKSVNSISILTKLFINKSNEVKLWVGLSLAKIGATAFLAITELYKNSISLYEKIILIDCLIKIDSDESNIFIDSILNSGTAEEIQFILESGLKLKRDYFN